jgi:glycosyltransferase involved in cell wall biosynthesis
MRVTLLHHTRLPVRGYGGTERVVVSLARGLAELGHEVALVAPEGSRVPEARVVPVPGRLIGRRGFDPAAFLPPGTDIVHAFFPLSAALPIPWVWTLEGTTRPGIVRPPNTIYVSSDHARRHQSESFVYNGLDPAELAFRAGKDDYDLFLGRLHRSKGYHWAIEGAARSRRRLVVAGGWRPTLSRRVRFVGEVDGKRKADLLAGARLLWMPAQWDEPFGLTLIEALWSGTPVLATRRGALPEVLSPEVAAFGDTLDELVAAIPEAEARHPEACRARAERYFSHREMADGYLRFYRAFLSSGTLPAGRVAAAS